MVSDTRDQIAAFRDAVPLELTPQLNRLVHVTEELISLHRRLALLVEAETRGKIEAYFESDEPTVAGRERYSAYRQLDNSGEIIRLKGAISAYEVERDYLRLVIEHA